MQLLHRSSTRFVADRIPDGAKVGLVKFSDDATILAPLTVIDATTKAEILAKIPTTSGGYTAIGKGLQYGLQVLGSQSQGGMIVLVTDGEENRSPTIKEVIPSIQQSGVTVNAVAFGDKASIHLEELIKATGGVGFYFNTTENTTAKIDMAFLSSMTSQYDLKEQPVTVIVFFFQPGRWEIEFHSSGHTELSWVVTSEPRDPNDQPVRAKSWIGDLELTYPAVARVYAQVSKGYEPVLGASVVATVDRPMGSLVDIELMDNGAGADGTRDDGIYSAYFTQFNGNGRYSVVARVVNNGQAGVRLQPRLQLSRSPPLPKPSHPFCKPDIVLS
ncbi:hypothetical protein LAZ67_13002973 [Cordylochernes scorpioides]|uniref:VWFA domain-containing protein n=1 Tax=Cordylochernes scorpioides TaxID=51811 RepID=A0ABY6L4W5_9ARAC|nr:hypothetical protein LAZ67_13002973 [Cordylochernes scorpioides]